MSEPERQILLWENATGAQSDISAYLFAYFDELSHLQLPVTTSQQLLAGIMTSYRPLVLARTDSYLAYYTYLLKNYIANARREDSRNAAEYLKTDLQVFLGQHTLKNTLKPLIERLKKRKDDRSLVFCNPQPVSFAKSGRKDAVIEKIHTIIGSIQVRGGGALPEKDRVAKAKQICEGRNDDEPLIYYDATKDYTKREWDRARLWQATQEFMPKFVKDVLWRPITGLKKVLEPSI